METLKEWAGDSCPICFDTWGGASQCRPKWCEVLDTVACTDCADQAERERAVVIPCGHCSYVFDRGRVVTYWRKETALYAAGLYTGYLCRKCADIREIKAGE